MVADHMIFRGFSKHETVLFPSVGFNILSMSLNLRRFFSGCLLFYFLSIVNTSFGSFQGQWSHDSKKFEICKLRSCFDGGHNVTASCKVNETTIWRCCVSNGTGIIG